MERCPKDLQGSAAHGSQKAEQETRNPVSRVPRPSLSNTRIWRSRGETLWILSGISGASQINWLTTERSIMVFWKKSRENPWEENLLWERMNLESWKLKIKNPLWPRSEQKKLNIKCKSAWSLGQTRNRDLEKKEKAQEPISRIPEPRNSNNLLALLWHKGCPLSKIYTNSSIQWGQESWTTHPDSTSYLRTFRDWFPTKKTSCWSWWINFKWMWFSFYKPLRSL